MLKPRAYIETTIPSFCHEIRTDPNIVARREWTRQWWAGAAESYELVTSTPVLEELAGGRPALSQERVALIRNLPRLPVESAILEIVEAYTSDRESCLQILEEMLCIWPLLLSTSVISWSRGTVDTSPTRISSAIFVG
jgi:hypothetical protein